MKVYGSDICPGCRDFKALQTQRGFEAEFIDITASVPNLRAFLKIRDNNPLFDEVRARGSIGIPAFENENGEVTLDVNTALAWIGEAPAEEEEGCASCK